MKILGVAIGLIILASFGCHRTPTKESMDSQVEWAYQLIDDGRFTEAIDLFWNLLQEEDTPTIRIGLASAYAARAGILVHSYWELVLPLVKAQPSENSESNKKIKQQWEQALDSLPLDLKERLSSKTGDILKASEQLEELKIRFQQIPLLKSFDQVGDVMMARSIIKDIPAKGTRLYRSLLSLVLLRFHVNSSSEEFNTSLKSFNSQNPCPTQFKNWITNLELPLNIISELILDVKVAYPSKNIEIEPFENQFRNYHSAFKNLIALLDSQFLDKNLCGSK